MELPGPERETRDGEAEGPRGTGGPAAGSGDQGSILGAGCADARRLFVVASLPSKVYFREDFCRLVGVVEETGVTGAHEQSLSRPLEKEPRSPPKTMLLLVAGPGKSSPGWWGKFIHPPY